MARISIKDVRSIEACEAAVQKIQSQTDFRTPVAWAIGLASYSFDGTMLDCRYPVVNVEGENPGVAALLLNELDFPQASAATALRYSRGGNWASAMAGASAEGESQLHNLVHALDGYRDDGKQHPNLDALEGIGGALNGVGPRHGTTYGAVAVVLMSFDDPIIDTADAYFRLHLLSHRKVRPHGVNLGGIFAVLPNNAWTNVGPLRPEDVDRVQAGLLAEGKHLEVRSIDKFPRMTDYVRPSGVRIADANRVRLGAHLAEGTTVMHEGFVNFNAGTLGKSMVEGRISAGVVVGANSDLGGGASIMGTLSGGGKEVISVGEGCLVGANAGIGISLGNNCLVEAGLYVTAGIKVFCKEDGTVRRASELSGQDHMRFIRDSQAGQIVMTRQGNSAELNPDLHNN